MVAGKPHPPIVELVRRRLRATGGSCRRPARHRRRASPQALGCRFGLVLSGVTAAADLPVDPTPDVVAADLAALVDRSSTWSRSTLAVAFASRGERS